MSTFKPLDMATFERLLEIHGSRIERWPEASRGPLDRLLESSELARARWKDAEHLDTLLAVLPEIEPAPDFMARIASLPARHPRVQRAGWWPFENPLTPLFAWGGAAALGLLLGVMGPDFTAGDSDAPADVAALDAPAADDDSAGDDGAGDDGAGDDGAGDDGADDWTDMSGLAMGADWALEDD